MNLKITGLNFDVTEAVREHVALKLERISRHASNLISVTVTLSLDKPDHKAEADAHLSGKNLHVEAVEGENMYAAIDVMMDKTRPRPHQTQRKKPQRARRGQTRRRRSRHGGKRGRISRNT